MPGLPCLMAILSRRWCKNKGWAALSSYVGGRTTSLAACHGTYCISWLLTF